MIKGDNSFASWLHTHPLREYQYWEKNKKTWNNIDNLKTYLVQEDFATKEGLYYVYPPNPSGHDYNQYQTVNGIYFNIAVAYDVITFFKYNDTYKKCFFIDRDGFDK